MPYMIVKEDGEFAVYKQGADKKPTGKAMGKHPSRDKANEQMKALYASEPDMAKKELAIAQKYYDDYGYIPPLSMPERLEPDDPRVNYGALKATATQACANCRWFDAKNAACALIWDDVVATGLCDLWLGETPKEEAMMQNPIPVVIVEAPATGSAELPTKPTTIESKESPIIAWLKKTFGKKQDEPLTGSGFKALPGNKWVSFFTNNFEDKAGEIFTEASHDQYIAWLDKGDIPYPDLWYWHIPGTKHGQAEWIDRVGHIMIAVGSFDDTPMADLFRKEYEKHPHMTSHTYGYPKQAKQDGVYHAYFTVEISPLPVGKEANQFTPFMEVKAMPTEEKKSALFTIVGKEMAESILKDGEKLSKSIEEKTDIKFKEAEGIPTVDTTARDAIKELATANKAANDANLQQLTDLLAAVKSLADGEKTRNEALTKLETYVKEQFSDAPRASRSKDTVVSPVGAGVENLQAALLQEKSGNPMGGNPNASVGENLAAMFMKQNAPTGQ